MDRCWRLVLLLCVLWAGALGADETAPLLAKIKAVGKEGAGNAEATKVFRELVKHGPESLVAILAAMDDADPTAANWLRNAVDAIAERELKAGRKLPADRLEAFVLDAKHNGKARRLAYEWLVRVDKTAPDRLLPGMLQDPSTELRRDAVARVVNESQALLEKDDKIAAKAAFEKAFRGARDRDQVDAIVKELKKLGVEVDLPRHFGFIQRWMLITPFDNPDEKGFAKVYHPEERVDLAAAYSGKKDVEAKWRPHVTDDPYGTVNLNKVLGKQKGTVAYAFSAVESAAQRPVEIRVGCINAVKVWLNGKPVIAVNEYHHGQRMDQYVGFGTLKKERNEILVKVCQNEQTEDWAQEWTFQLRLCDSVGGGVPLTAVTEKGGRK